MRSIPHLCFMLCLYVLFTPHAQASDPIWQRCTSIDEGGEAADNAAFSLGTLVDFDGKAYWIMQGSLDVPTPSYGYAFTLGAHKGRTQHATLKLIPPTGGMISVIDTLNMTIRHEMKRPFHQLVINIDKSFHWGAVQIVCKTP
jgi:hypothetical protein